MNNSMESKLKDVKKSQTIESFIWRSEKTIDVDGKYKQSEKRLIDMSESELKNCYEHCKIMLFNKNVQNPGRYLVLDLINEQKNKIGVELFLRFLQEERGMSRFTLITSLNEFLNNNREAFKDYKPLVSDVFLNVDANYKNIPISLIIDGCLDRLGVFNKKHITRTFILKQGIWLTPTETKELTEYNEAGNMIEKLKVIRERLFINEIEKLNLNAKGLNYTQMRSVISIKFNKKYTELSTVALETLRYRLLFNLEETVRKHIYSWEKRMEEIDLVAKHNGFNF